MRWPLLTRRQHERENRKLQALVRRLEAEVGHLQDQYRTVLGMLDEQNHVVEALRRKLDR